MAYNSFFANPPANTSNVNPNTGGLFGLSQNTNTTQTNTTTPSLFGNINPSPNPQPQPPMQPFVFSNTNTNATSTGGSLFGQQTQQPSTTGLGATSTPGQSLFGNTNTNAGSTNTTAANTGSLFGQQSTTGQQGTQPSLFGNTNTNAATNTTNTNPTTTGGSLFGQLPQPSTGVFGNVTNPTSTSSTAGTGGSGLLGTNTNVNTSNTNTNAGGIFGLGANTNTNTGNQQQPATTGTTGNSLFGLGTNTNTNTSNQQQPATTGTTGSSLFGLGTNTNTNTSNQQQQGTTGTTGNSLFGLSANTNTNTSNQQQGTTGTTGNSLFGLGTNTNTNASNQSQQGTTGTTGNSLFGLSTNTNTSNQQQQGTTGTTGNSLFGLGASTNTNTSNQPQQGTTGTTGNSLFSNQFSQQQQQPQQQPPLSSSNLFSSRPNTLTSTTGVGTGVTQLEAQEQFLKISQGVEMIYQAWNPATKNCRFQYIFYNLVDPKQVSMYGRPPNATNDALWEKAVRENPDPTCLVPVIAIGFDDLRERANAQSTQSSSHLQKLTDLSNRLKSLLTEHSISNASRLQRAHNAQTQLVQRLMRLVQHLHLLIPAVRNSSIRVEEEELRGKLEEMEEELKRGRVKGKLNEMWALLGAVGAFIERGRGDGQGGQGEWAVVDDEGLAQITQILAEQQAGLQHLTKILQKDQKDLAIIMGSGSVGGDDGYLANEVENLWSSTNSNLRSRLR